SFCAAGFPSENDENWFGWIGTEYYCPFGNLPNSTSPLVGSPPFSFSAGHTGGALPDETSHAEQSNLICAEGAQTIATSADGPHVFQNTAVIANILCFLDDCSDLMYTLSGQGITAKDLHSFTSFHQEHFEVRSLIKNAYILSLRSEQSFRNLPSEAVLSIAERFVEIGYLHSIDEVKDYLMNVGKAILPNRAAYHEFCLSVLKFPEEVKLPVRPPCMKPEKKRPGSPAVSQLTLPTREGHYLSGLWKRIFQDVQHGAACRETTSIGESTRFSREERFRVATYGAV
ncbi:hypothetical protein FALBO_8370, partial [Fusarium albosuccineum]